MELTVRTGFQSSLLKMNEKGILEVFYLFNSTFKKIILSRSNTSIATIKVVSLTNFAYKIKLTY